MSQFDFGTIDPYVVDGVELADFLNQWRDAIYSLHRGATRPPYVVPGMLWVSDAGGPSAWVLNWYVSPTVGDVALFTLNTTTGGITISASAGGSFAAATLLAQAVASPQVQWNATGNPIDAKNWRMTVNGAGALVLASYSDAGVLLNSITFNRDGSISPMPPLPAARFEAAAAWSWGVTTYIRVGPFNTAYNFGAGTMASNGIWTPGAGLWRFECSFNTGNSTGANTQVGLYMRKNGAGLVFSYAFVANGTNQTQRLSTSQQFNATDTIEFGGDVSGGGALQFSGPPNAYIEGFRLR